MSEREEYLERVLRELVAQIEGVPSGVMSRYLIDAIADAKYALGLSDPGR